MNITDVIRRNAHAFPEREALVCNGDPLGYGALQAMVERVATQCALAGVGRGDRIGVAVNHPAGYVVTVLALAHLGAPVTPFHAARPRPLREAVAARHRLTAVVVDPPNADLGAEHPGLRLIPQRSLFAELPRGQATVPPATEMDNEPWMLALSSGTTGLPKSIPQGHARSALVATLVSGRVLGRRTLVLFDLSTSVGMNAVVRQLYAGHTAIVTDLRGRFFETLRRDRPDQVLASTGDAVALVQAARDADPDSRAASGALASILLSGSAVSPGLRRDVCEWLSPHLHVQYGATEAGAVASLAPEDGDRPGCAGRLMPWVEAQAVDGDGRALPAGQTGLLRLRSPTLVQGYLGDPDASARAFRDGWYYPGDIGRVDEAGYLYLAGRIDDRLNLGGNKIDPVPLEAYIDGLPGVRESVLLAATVREAVGPELVALVVADTPATARAIVEACRQAHGVRHSPSWVVFAAALPRNGAGKIDRRAAGAMVDRVLAARPAPRRDAA